MKKILLFTWSISIAVCVEAQQELLYKTTVISVPLAKQLSMSDEVQDFNPKLQLIQSSAPAPQNGILYQKLLLDQQRKAYSLVKKNQIFNKQNAPSPQVEESFNGNGLTQGTPNDNDMAISNSGIVVSVVNTNITIFNDTGKVLSSKSLATFANALGSLNRTFDPRVIYDPIEDRFVVVFLQGSTSADTRVILAFSATADPTQNWNFYVLPGNVTGDSSWSDYPIISLSKTELFVTLNRVKDNTPWQTGFITSYIWQCDKKAGYAAADTINPKLWHDITYNGASIWSVCPVKGGSTLYGPNMYFLSQRPSDLSNDTVFLHEITNTHKSGNAILKTKVLRTNTAYGLQPNAIQPNGKKLQTNDARVLSACYENWVIHYVGNTIDTSLFVPAVYYGRLYGASGNTPTIEGKIISYDTMDIGYPSISYMGNGKGDNSMLITFSHVSPTLFPGTSVVFADRNGNISDPVIVKYGIGNINVIADSVNRWGDYTGNQRKYNEPGVCWVNGSYGTASESNRTWIAKLRSADPTLSIFKPKPSGITTHVYPNPTAETVTVDFIMENSQFIELSILDLGGKTVAHLLRDKAKSGLNRFTFSANDLPNGTYILTINNESTRIHQHQFVVAH
jgi:hypothetical protein